MAWIDVIIVFQIFHSLLRLVNSMPFEVLELLPSVLLVQELDTAMDDEISIVGRHAWSIYYSSFWQPYKSCFLGDFMNDCLDLRELIDILDLKRGLSFVLALLGAGLVVGLILVDYLFDQVDKVLIFFKLIGRNIVISRVKRIFEIGKEFWQVDLHSGRQK